MGSWGQPITVAEMSHASYGYNYMRVTVLAEALP